MEAIEEHHIKDEESKLFKSAEKALDPDAINNIMKQFKQDKQKIKKNLK
jgi:hemerythrin-like domain-containing protein